MKEHKKMPPRRPGLFERFSGRVTKMAGSTPAFIIAFGLILAWAVTGPLFDFSESWQLVVNTGTTIITFLMVFLIQKAQNKDALAIQLKLDELIAATEKASNRLVDVEDMTEEELDVIRKYYRKLREISEKQKDFHSSHSLDEAERNEKEKHEMWEKRKDEP